MKKLLTLILLLFCLNAFADTNRITLTITVTNAVNCTNGTIYTVNGVSLMATNLASHTASTFNTNATAAGLKTNLFFQIAAYPISAPRLALVNIDATSFALVGDANQALTYDTPNNTTNWASFVLTTQLVTKALAVRVPIGVEQSTNQQYIASQLIRDLDTYGTNSFKSNSIALREFISRGTNQQTKLGKIGFNQLTTSTNKGIMYGGTNDGVYVQNASRIHDAKIVIADAGTPENSDRLSFAGTNGNPVQYIGANYTGQPSLYNYSDDSPVTNTLELTSGETLVNWASLRAWVPLKESANTWSASNTFNGTDPNFFNTTVYLSGYTVAPNLMASNACMPNLSTTNHTAAGSNNITGSLAFIPGAISTLANGSNNIVAPITNIFLRLSGPTDNYGLAGIQGGRNGQMVYLFNASGYNLAILHQSGADATAGERIITYTGADCVYSNNCTAQLIYSGTDSRWILIGH